MTARSFGRRNNARPIPPSLPAMRKFSLPAHAPAAPAGSESARIGSVGADPVDDELKAWKKARGPSRYLKPLALTASLCFGIASVVLPASVTDWVQYPLYALSAASLYVGFRHKRQRR